MGSLIEELQAREAEARAEADGLRVRIEELSEELARAEEQATRLAIAREEVARILEDPSAAEPAAEEPPAGGQDGAGLTGRSGGPVSRIGSVTVPPWQEGADVSVLPRLHRDLLEVAQDAGRPLRAREIAAAAGLDTAKAKIEGLRSRLKLLVARGWLDEAPGGRFTPADHAGKSGKPGRLRVLLPKFGGADHPGRRKKNPHGRVLRRPSR